MNDDIAVELLACLKAVFSLLNDGSVDYYSWKDACKRWSERSIAVIAKAEGREVDTAWLEEERRQWALRDGPWDGRSKKG